MSYDPTITLGNLITLIVIVVGFVASYVRQDMRISWLERWAKDHQLWAEKKETEFIALKISVAQHRAASGLED